MNVSAPFIVRPIATTLLMIGVTLLGLVAYFILPIAGVPQVDVPTIRVSASLPGANAETMATSVAAPLESQLSLISGVTSISSTSSLGQTQIQVEFDLGRSIEGAAQDVQTAISAAGGLLPKNLPNPPTYEKINPADSLLMSIAVTSEDLPISKVDEYVENYLTPQISRITGVGLVDYHGQQKPAIRIQINPMVASAMGVSLEDVRAAVVTATVNVAQGHARRRQAVDDARHHRPDLRRRHVQLRHRRLSQRRAGAGERPRPRHRRRREHPRGGVAQWRARRRDRRAQAARIQHQPDRPAREGRAAGTRAPLAAVDQAAGARRPHPDDPRLGRRCSDHDGDQHRAGGARDLPVPAPAARDASSRASPSRCRCSRPARSCTSPATPSTMCR